MSISRTAAWFVWVIAAIFYAYQYILRVMPNVMMCNIMEHFNIDSVVFGQFSGVYYLGYSLMHMPIGIMLDRFGPRKVMSGCILLTVLGTLPIIYTDHWIYPIIGRVLIGIGSSAAILGAFKIIRMVFEEKHFTRMLSLAVTIGVLGAIYGGGPVSYMMDNLGYKAVVEIISAMGVLLAIITYIIVPDMEPTPHGTVFSDIKTVLTNWRVVLLCISAGFMVGPMEGFADVWGARFLNHVYDFDMKLSSSLTSMVFIGMCFGGPLLSLIAEKTGSYNGSIIGAGIIMFVCFVVLILGFLTQKTIIISFFIVGICCAYQIMAIYKASTYVPDNVAGLTTAVANMIIMIFGYGFHSVIGYIVHIFGGSESKEAFIYGITVIPVALAIGVIGLLVLNYADRKGAKNII
jgi:MFS family permease